MPVVVDQVWNLESILPGGVEGPAFQARLDELLAELEPLLRRADQIGDPATDTAWHQVIPALVAFEEQVHQLWSFVSCWAAADTEAAAPAAAEARLAALGARLHRAWTVPTDWLARCTPDTFDRLRSHPALAQVQVALDTARGRAPVTLPLPEQRLFNDLSDDAFHAWGQVYRRLSGRLRIPFEGEQLSIAQARNRLETRDPDLRRRLMDATDQAWSTVADDCAVALTRIIGIRHTLHRQLGVDELVMPLVNQRIERATLLALRSACHQSRGLVGRYLRAKARLLGRDELDIQDIAAPVGDADLRVAWPQAQDLVIDQAETFSADMADFFRHALSRGWVESEDRPGKRAGAFCASFPASQQSRVFMTFGGGPSSVRTLAHELGHAYHNHVIRDLPRGQRAMTACLAETASTFAETVVRQAMLSRVDDSSARLALLDRELADTWVFLSQLMVRFDFERALFELRGRGPLRSDELTATMERIQREWYGPDVRRLDTLLWASKLHFYLTRAPFYNFSYTFGYLFSSMVYRRARAEGPQWAATYRQLLRDTQQGSAEALAERYLGVDLTRAATWLEPIRGLEPLVQEFEAAAS